MKPARPVKTASAKKPAKGTGSIKGEVFRQSRIWHSYLSAFAFIALIFFSITGLLLNHPDWFEGEGGGAPREQTLQLAPADLAKAKAAADPGKALASIVQGRVDVLGGFKSAETIDDESLLSFESVKGRSDVTVNLASGKTEISTQHFGAVAILNQLHRGKNSGAAWGLVIDLTAIIVMILSVIGYILFFSLRFRLRTSLILTAASLAVLVAVYILLIP